ncbi:MAG: hypothetical protein ACD_67C00076G0003 [uncultured bacterium]|nr:MAG: hypothetical protein ACD_67C00076G0003 [uncultured bacterium]
MNCCMSMPATLMIEASAEAPGIGKTMMPFAIASATRMFPGSETPGVPASVTNATFFPASISSIIF